MIEDAFSIITEEIEKIDGRKKHTSTNVFICCPFHDEKTPSLSINMSMDAKVNVGTFMCFSGKTKVMTYDGVKRIKKLSGDTHKVLTDGGVWVDAEFKAFGEQRLYKLALTRNGVTKNIYTTAEHDWYVHERKKPTKTIDLLPGTYLQTNPLKPKKLSLLNLHSIRHGFVVGDGTAQKLKSGRVTGSIAYLINEKLDYMGKYFPIEEFPNQYTYDLEAKSDGIRNRKEGVRHVVTNLPVEYKSLPALEAGDDYLYGFLAGLLAADGCVDKDGTVSLHSSDKKFLKAVRDIATRVGINTLSITCQMRRGFDAEEETAIYRTHFTRGTFPSELLLNPEHRRRFEAKPPKWDYLRWRVVGVQKTKRIETVYCCVVPETHRFTLEDNILTGNCFGCPEKGNWNVLAKKLGLREVKEWQHFQGSSDKAVNKLRKAKKDFARFNSYSIDRLFEELGGAVLPWPKEKEWRDYPGAMIRRVDGYMYNDERRDELMLALPVYINGRYRGGVKALWEKPKDGPSYINTNGDWVLNYGLLGYDFIKQYELWGCTSVVLCEGPRDWLRLVLNKIPAVGILGSKMFGEKKLMLLMSLGIKKIYTLADNDKAGTSMVRLIEKVCRGFIEVEELQLPRKIDEDGKLIKCDPDSADQKVIDKVKAIVYEGAKKPKKLKSKAEKKRA